MLVLPEILRGTRQSEITGVITDDGLNLIEDIVCESCRIVGGLWEVGHHDGSVLTTLCHLVEIDEDARITLFEVDALREKHRGVAVGVEGEDAVVKLMCLAIVHSLLHQPLEERQTTLHALGMPLNTQDGFVFAALHRLDDAIGGCGNDTELGASVADGLMVEGVDE